MSKILVDTILSRRVGVAITFDNGASCSGVTTTSSSLTASGIATATTFVGDGSSIIGISKRGSMIGIIVTSIV